MITLTIDEIEAKVAAHTTLLEAAQEIDVYIPKLCYHPDLPSAPGLTPTGNVYHGSKIIKTELPSRQGTEFAGCELCVVYIEGLEGLYKACITEVKEGMVVQTNTPEIQEYRRDKLSKILATHPHACLTCAEREGCTREPCSLNVPVEERCCEKFGRCEVQKVAEYVGIREDTPRYIPQKLPIINEEPLFIRNYNLCIACMRCVRACRNLREVDAMGAAFDGENFIVGSVGSSLRESGCKFCGACVEVCPTGALLDKEIVWADREEVLLPCVSDCPIGIDVPRYIRLVKAGDYSEATAVIREKTPLPSVLAHVCHHPCELRCRRTNLEGALNILGLKRVALDNDTGKWKKKVLISQPTGKHVAVIGSGPTGLTAAYHLTRLGHDTLVFEALPEPGGMLRYGIPNYRLPTEILETDIQNLQEFGVKIQTNSTVGKTPTIPELLSQGYDAVLVAIGAQQSRKLDIVGVNLQGVFWGVEFLKGINLNQAPKIGKEVVVVGGGSVAIDVARTAIRLGADKVMVACLESEEEMPAHDWEIKEAEEEGVVLYPSWGPRQILGKAGKVSGLELVCCTCVFDEDDQFNPIFDEEKTHHLEADMVILAIGQAVDLSTISSGVDIGKAKNGTIVVNKENFQTTLPGIFAAGDAITGPTSVVEAIAAGRQAAASIDKYLGGHGSIEEELTEEPLFVHQLGRDGDFASWARNPIPLLAVAQRCKSFDEAELSLSKKESFEEARRCLQCDLRLLFNSVGLPPEEWLDFVDENLAAVPASPGVFILADAEKNVLLIKGATNLQEALQQQGLGIPTTRFFKYEEDPLYTKRETELLQQYVQEHGSMPGEDELDDLF